MIKIKFGKGSVKEATDKDVKADELTDGDTDLLKGIDLKGLEQKDYERYLDYKFILDNGYIPIEKPVLDKPLKSYGPMRGDPDKEEDKKNYRVSAWMGAGAYGKVFEATKAGTDKRYAVKITSDAQEFRVRTRIEEIRDSLPEEVAQHFVKMEEVKMEKNVPVSPFVPNPKYLIALQLVRPMNTVEKTALFNGTAGLQKFIANSNFRGQEHITNFKFYKESFLNGLKKAPLRDLMDFFPKGMFDKGNTGLKSLESFLHELIPDLEDALDKFGEGAYKEVAKKAIKVARAAEMQELVGLYKFVQLEVVKKLVDSVNIDDKLGEYSKHFSPNFAKKDDPGLGKLLRDKIIKLLTSNYIVQFAVMGFRKVSGIENVQSNKKDLTMKFHYLDLADTLTDGDHTKFDDENYILDKLAEFDMPEKVRSLIYSLLYVAAKHGLYFQDLHENNIMVDPRTGEYVAVDVGLFRMASRLKMLDKGMKESKIGVKLIISLRKNGKKLVG